MHSFTFLLNTNGMRLYNEDGQYYLATSADAEEKMYLGQIVVYDAKGEPCPGTMSITTVTMGQQYQITVSADPDFLTNPNTEYPVTIDPSLTISDSTQSGAIEDASIYGNKPTVNAGSWTYNHCGYYTSSSTVYGVSRTVYRLTGLINDTTWATIVPEHIVSAKLYVKEASGEAGATINLHALTNTTWTELGVNWNNVGSHTTTVYASSAPGYGAWGEWDITSLAIGWKYSLNINAGFILISADETADSKTLYASEYGTPDRRPYFTVTYNYDTDGLNYTSKDIDEAHAFQLTWPGVDAPITWSSSNSAIASVSSTGIVTGVKAGTATISATAAEYGTKTCTVYVTIADGVYYIKSSNGFYLGTSGSTAENTATILQSKATFGISQIRQLWKIKYIAEGYYSIRPMHKLDMGLHATSGSVDICSVGTSDTLADLPSLWRWSIVYDSTGYTLRHVGTVSMSMRPEASGAYPGLEIITGSYNGSSLYIWTFEALTSTTANGTLVNVQFSFDYGAVTRFGSSDNISSMILDRHFLNVSNTFAQQCGIYLFSTQSNISPYLSDADLCPNSSINESCECSACLLEFFENPTMNNSSAGFQTPAHCKSITRLRNNLVVGLPSNTMRITYTGHVVCFYDGTDCNNPVGGLSDYAYPIICICNSPMSETYSASTLAHEISHFFGVESHHDKKANEPCVMAGDDNREWFYPELESYWCSECLEIIKNNADKLWIE